MTDLADLTPAPALMGAVPRSVNGTTLVEISADDGALVGQARYPSWNDATYEQALQDSTHSYLGDQAKELERVIGLAANDPEFEIVDMLPSQAPPPPPPVAAPPPLPPQVMAPPQQRLWQPPSPGRTANTR